MEDTLIVRITHRVLHACAIICAISISGCHLKSYEMNNSGINKLQERVSKLERNLIEEEKAISNQKEKLSSLINSITIRLGSNDDRLRIYWRDGSKTDLPCNKEMKMWACG